VLEIIIMLSLVVHWYWAGIAVDWC